MNGDRAGEGGGGGDRGGGVATGEEGFVICNL